jgi:hypothetical protein
MCSQDSVGNIATRPRHGQPRNCGSIPSRGKRIFASPKSPEWLWGPLILLFRRYHRLFPQAYREDDNSPVSSDKVENERSYTSTSQYAMELNITEISACYKIRLAELIHNTAQAPLRPKYLMMIKK